MTAVYRYCPRCAAALETRAEGGRARAACPDRACGYVHWDNPLPVVAALVQCEDRAGQVLLAHNRAWPVRFFALITGFLERGESPEAAVLRELAEETALSGEIAGFIGVYPFLRRNELILAYHVRARGEIRLSDELSEYVLVPPQRLRHWAGGTGDAIRDWLLAQGLPLSEPLAVPELRPHLPSA